MDFTLLSHTTVVMTLMRCYEVYIFIFLTAASVLFIYVYEKYNFKILLLICFSGKICFKTVIIVYWRLQYALDIIFSWYVAH